MDVKQNPWSLYDFLGYFTPGAIFIYSLMVIYAHSKGLIISDELSFEDKGELYLPFVLAAYTTGHLLSFISSVFIEKFSVWLTDYPSKYLLDFGSKGYFYGNRFIRFMVAAFLAPISIPEYLLHVLFKYRKTYSKPLDGLLIKIIKAKSNALLKAKCGLTKMPTNTHARTTDFFRFLYHYAVENAPNHFPKMQNYVAIYGFLRTMTLISVLLFWTFIFHFFIHEYKWINIVFITAGLFFLNITFYMAFVKFWRRFTLETFMAIAATFDSKNIDPDSIDKPNP